MLAFVVAHDHDRVRAFTEKSDHLTGRRSAVDQIADADQQIVRAEVDFVE
ncbi:hypothetical protein Airi02_060800 [Actinoallomurus iriomotensis]|uniref:Uncharacterized protein n=1 Tax=Actinoallomurus iriomotensis TaxID=478107 RepID=A0A9W6S3Y7_9ACTN|nr:hypothetical protein Airi02_060800 [Actinoallomurus iriomotensis]